MSNALINLATKQRDAHAQMMDAWQEFLETLGPVDINTKVVPEETFFNITYEGRTTEKLGPFEVAEKDRNDPERFALAFSILKANESTIAKRYHGRNYVFSYWIYNEDVYRQILKK